MIHAYSEPTLSSATDGGWTATERLWRKPRPTDGHWRAIGAKDTLDDDNLLSTLRFHGVRDLSVGGLTPNGSGTVAWNQSASPHILTKACERL